jgi:UDP-N-acetylbacillosamine N-acetyltransferase
MTPLYIIGAGGHGAVVAEVAAALGYSIAGFIDDDPAKRGLAVLDWTVVGGRDILPAGAHVVPAIGHNAVRDALLADCSSHGWTLVTLVHPSAVVSRSAVLDAGTVVLPLAAVNARARIGRGCIINTAAVVEHDCVVGDAAHIAPGVRLAGTVTVGARTLLGVGSAVLPGITIGADAVIGAGAVVVRDVPEGVVAHGNPARIQRRAIKL